MKNTQKTITKYENVFMVLSTADVLLSTTQDSQSLLHNAEIYSYIIDDDIIDMSSYINYSLFHSDIPEKARELLNNIVLSLLDVGTHLNDLDVIKFGNPYVAATVRLVNDFTNMYSYIEYADIMRRIAKTSHNMLAFQALVYLLDFFYERDYIYLSLDKKQKIIYGVNCKNQRLSVALCYLNTIDNVNDKAAVKYAEAMCAYIKLKYPNINEILSFMRNNRQLMIHYVKFHKVNCLISKYKPDAPSFTYHSLQPYIEQMSLLYYDPSMVMLNLLIALPRDVLKKRRFIVKNGPLPFAVKLPLVFFLTENAPDVITDIGLYEETVSFQDSERRVIYIKYTYCEHTQTIPVDISDMHVLLCVLNPIDLFLVMYLLDLYNVFEIKYFENNFVENFQSLFGEYLPNYMQQDSEKSEKQSNVIHTKYQRMIENAEITVSAYVRKLPKGQVASEDAKALARKLYLDLPSGCTVVSEHIRKYHK